MYHGLIFGLVKGLVSEETQFSMRCDYLDDRKQVRFRVRNGGMVVGNLITAGCQPAARVLERNLGKGCIRILVKKI